MLNYTEDELLLCPKSEQSLKIVFTYSRTKHTEFSNSLQIPFSFEIDCKLLKFWIIDSVEIKSYALGVGLK